MAHPWGDAHSRADRMPVKPILQAFSPDLSALAVLRTV
jgi:hypothetical protein